MYLFSFPSPAMQAMAATATWMFLWWVTEALPLATTSLLPLVLFPVLGIMPMEEVAKNYINSTIFLFLGGFLIAQAMEKTLLHKQIALAILRLFGTHPKWVLLGFMFSSCFLSMWISNTATTLMLLPIALSVIQSQKEEQSPVFSAFLLLGIAYASSLGGTATLVGTAPNLSFHRIFQITFPDKEPPSFGAWFVFFAPLALLLVVLFWFYLYYQIKRFSKRYRYPMPKSFKRLWRFQPLTLQQRWVLGVFLCTVLLWLFRKPLRIGALTLPGWSQWFTYNTFINDGTVAIFCALFLFAIPVGGKPILDNQAFLRLPWDLLLLFGGGFALAQGFVKTKLSAFIGEQFVLLKSLPPFLLLFIVCLSVNFLTELTSNTATTEMLLPILASVALKIEVAPIRLMLPATIAASYAFMMPIATPPNAIVFGTRLIPMQWMVKTGIGLNLLSAFLLTLWMYLLL